MAPTHTLNTGQSELNLLVVLSKELLRGVESVVYLGSDSNFLAANSS